MRSAAFGAFEFDYDANDNVQTRRVTDARGLAVESRFYNYDGKNRVLEERLLRGASASFDEGFEKAAVDYRYTYDRASSLDNTQRNLAGKVASLRIFPGAT